MEKGSTPSPTRRWVVAFSKGDEPGRRRRRRARKSSFSDLMERYLVRMNIADRAQMVDMAERLQAIEGQLDEIRTLLQQMNAVSTMTRDSPAAAPKPPRTKRPPPSGEQK